LIEQPERVAELRKNGVEFIAANNWTVKQDEYFSLLDRLAAKKKKATEKPTWKSETRAM
jgi:hypothetical protein